MISMKWSLLVFLSLVALARQEDVDAPRVKTPLGAIRGSYKISYGGRQYEAYEGIPYALPPVGKLRFKPPQHLSPWAGELPATKFGSICLQYEQSPRDLSERVTGSEDCLYLNVYVPVRDVAEGSNAPLLPVLFWIHGGSFQYGTGQQMGPKYLMDRDVVYVSINYRLGPLGFLSTEDEVVPGNMGLKDQNMALRWVSENIEWFGGDPKKVTLVGLSAGGASVHYHYLSPLSAGLFQGGISISGTSFDCWTQTENSLEKAKKLAGIMGCPTVSNKEMVRCLRYRPGRALVQADGDFMPFFFNPFTPFGPVTEKSGDAPFIDRSPAEIVSSGDVQDLPWVTSVVSEEGLYPVAEFIADKANLKTLDENWDLLAPHFLDYNYTLPREKHVEVGRLVKKHYFGTKKIDETTEKELIQMAGDRFFVVDSEKAARMQAKVNKNPVWYYYYSYRATESLSNTMSRTKRNFGVSHGDDAYLVVDSPFVDATLSQNDLAMQEKLIDLWVSFATNKMPSIGNANWLKLDPSKKEFQYLHISSPSDINMETNDNLGQKQFWNTIKFNENVLKRGMGNPKDEF